MKIIVEEIKKDPTINIIETTPYAGVKKAKVSIEVEDSNNFSNLRKIIRFPYTLYVYDLSKTIGRDQEYEFVHENLTSHSKEELDKWIKKNLIKK